MYEYLNGRIAELTPTYVVIDINGVGYLAQISLNTYSSLKADTNEKLYVHQVIREDAHLFFAFKNKSEREVFRMLISVSGIGANTARMILSSLTPEEVAHAITKENIRLLQSIKGIGAKTAQRMVIELKDKMSKIHGLDEINTPEYNTLTEEALSALVMLGFQKSIVEKTISQVTRESKDLTVEELIKKVLKVL